MNENYRDDLSGRLKSLRQVDKEAAKMVLEKESNTEEYKKAKETHLEESRDMESSKLENNLNSLENDIQKVGGEEGIKKTWSSFDEQKRVKIMERISKFEETRRGGVDMQEAGRELFLDPRGLGFDSWKQGNDESGIAKVVGPLGYLSGAFPITGLAFEGIGAIPRIYGSFRKILEQRKLARIEKKYQ
jgi:hypothetical protein